MALDNAGTTLLANAILTALHPVAATATIGTKTITYPILVRLMTANGTATANGTELTTGGSYTAAGTGITTGPGANWAAASAGSQATNAICSQTNMPAATIVGIELWDSTATKIRTEWGSMTSKTTSAGDTLSFASGAISSALA
jgi:hypothetical protein